jgi:hypothetical protein
MLEGEPGGPFEVAARAFAGEPVEFALRDTRSGRLIIRSPLRPRSTSNLIGQPTTS